MSHIVKIQTEIKDLDSLQAACKELGFHFIEGQTKYKWYGRSVGDYPLPEGIEEKDLGKCNHAIKLDGAQYEIGVVKLPSGKYTLLYDFWDDGQTGGKLLERGAPKLVQSYNVHFLSKLAKQNGKNIMRSMLPDGTIRLTLKGNF